VQKNAANTKNLTGVSLKIFRSYSIVFFNWAVYYFAYFGLQFSIGNFGKVALLNFIFFGFIEIGGIYLATALSKRYSAHVKTMRWLSLVGGIACLIIRDQTSALSVISILSQLISRQTFHNALLSDPHGLHAGAIPDPVSVPGPRLLLALRKAPLLDCRLR
jgi:hypothetical protein